MTIDALLSKLKKPKKSGDRQWTAHCPAHDDRKPSLSISVGDQDQILLHCHAGCNVEEICGSLGVSVAELYDKPLRREAKVWGRIVAEYDYRDADGTLLYQIRRDEHKNFWARRPSPDGGGINGLGDTERVLYRLPELTDADIDELVFIPEGEKDSNRLWDDSLVATTNPFGAGNWSKLKDVTALNGRVVVIIPDRDDRGRQHALEIARSLHGRAREVRVLDLPDEAHDVSDWFDAGGTGDALRELAASADVFDGTTIPDWLKIQNATNATVKDQDDNEDEGGPRTGSQATIMVSLCEALEFFHDNDTAYVTMREGKRQLTWAVRGKAFRSWLARQFYMTEGKAPATQAIANALNVLEGQAQFQGPQITTHLRVAQHDGCIYVDLADDECRVVEIATDGWRICDDPPVRFRRPGAMRPLPVPVHGGSLEQMRALLNIDEDRDFILTCAWLVAAFRPGHPTPILTFSSEQGSGKTTAAKMLRKLVDPNHAPVRAEPGSARDLMVAANHSHVLAIDNSSGVPVWLSDALCRLSTGGGFATRMLYENDEECLFTSLRPVILTGIEEIGSRSDLLDRMIRINLPSIPEDRRRSERSLDAEFEALRPLLLGAIFDAVSMALRNINSVELPALPRMADLAQWIVAAEPALPWAAGNFMRAYWENRATAHDLAIDASPIGETVRMFAREHGEWTGTASRLLQLLNETKQESAPFSRAWPKTAHHMSNQLRRIAPNLREVGVHVIFHERTHAGRLLTVRWEPPTSVTSVTERHVAAGDASDMHRCDAGDADDAESNTTSAVAMSDEQVERAAILEFDSGMSRGDAEALACADSSRSATGREARLQP